MKEVFKKYQPLFEILSFKKTADFRGKKIFLEKISWEFFKKNFFAKKFFFGKNFFFLNFLEKTLTLNFFLEKNFLATKKKFFGFGKFFGKKIFGR